MTHAAARSEGTCLSPLYRHLAARRGKKRAIMVVAQAIVVSPFHILARREPYDGSGPNYFDEQPLTMK